MSPGENSASLAGSGGGKARPTDAVFWHPSRTKISPAIIVDVKIRVRVGQKAHGQEEKRYELHICPIVRGPMPKIN